MQPLFWLLAARLAGIQVLFDESQNGATLV
jgi:hypothetical protein